MIDSLLQLLASVVPVAQANQDWLTSYCETLHPGCGAGSEFIVQIAERVIDVVLDIIGGVAVIMFLWGAGMITTSGGNDERKTQGKDIIIAAIIGVFLAVIGNVILEFVANFVKENAGG